MQSSTDPEGIKTKYEYDGRGNISKATRYPRPGILNPDGSTPAPTIVEAAYDIFNPKSQSKPLWMKDANGNVTSYTYSPDHGGVLTETGPAVAGVTPQKRYSYVQRQARLWDGSAAGPAVWLLDRMAFCRTGNPAGRRLRARRGRRGGDDLRLRPGQRPQPPASARPGGERRRSDPADLLRLRPAGPQDQRDQPQRTRGLAACPAAPPAAALPYTSSTRYDADGRVTGTIAPDPDGAGGNGAPAVRNSYDPAGRLVKVEQGALAAWQSGKSVAPSAWTGLHRPQDARHRL